MGSLVNPDSYRVGNVDKNRIQKKLESEASIFLYKVL